VAQVRLSLEADPSATTLDLDESTCG